MIAAAELLALIANRVGFALTIESGDTCRIIISDESNELRGGGDDFETAWASLQVVETDPTISAAHYDAAVAEMLNMAAIWTDMEMARIEAEHAPPVSDRAAYRAWLTWPDDDEILPAEMTMSLPG